ncbi:Arc-like DNA binding domain protein [compost metagenome]
MSATKEKKVVGVRLVDLMRETLSAKADQNGRSLSGEIVYRLRKSLEQEVRDEAKQSA